MDPRIIPEVAQVVSDAARPLTEAVVKLAARDKLAGEAAKLMGLEAKADVAVGTTSSFSLADPRTYSARFTSPTDPEQRRIYKSVEAIAAIVRNSGRTDEASFETAVDIQNKFGRANFEPTTIEQTAEYLKTATGLELTPQAVRFRDHNAVPGHYVMFVKGFNDVERMAYGRILSPQERYIFEPLRGKEFSWQQLNQFNRRVVAAHRLDLPGTNAVGTATSIDLARAQRPPVPPDLIAPPDSNGGLSRWTGFPGVAAMLRNESHQGAKFENAFDVEQKFGESKLAKLLSPTDSRVFGRHYIQLATGSELSNPVPLADALAKPGHYAVFFDGHGKLAQSAFLKVSQNGEHELFYPRFNKLIKPEEIRERNPVAFLSTPKTPPPEQGPMDLSTLTDAKQIPFDHATIQETEARVARLLPFHTKGGQIKQNFIIETPAGHTIRVVHNGGNGGGLAPLQLGGNISLRGEYVVDPGNYGVFHWTHRGNTNETGEFIGGFLKVDGKKYG